MTPQSDPQPETLTAEAYQGAHECGYCGAPATYYCDALAPGKWVWQCDEHGMLAVIAHMKPKRLPKEPAELRALRGKR